ncbi:MAG TPA: hypothetical protein PLP33_24675 [Leptospiraceae bacterium]|nr:hypothetical protein [Leptospiraceae bacterium]
MAEKISLEDARKAYETLLDFGKQSFRPEFQESASEGKKLGNALVKVTDYDADEAFEASAAWMEELNYHEIAKMLRES